ncbi:MAG: choice-of-anchor Q domain-containing protein, partial [Planctomycetota bacterium JB042]
RYHGAGGYSGVYMSGAGGQVTLTNCTIRDGKTNGVDANSNVCDLTLVGCALDDNEQRAGADLRIEHVATFDGNTASGNGGDHFRVSQPDPAVDTTLGPQCGLGGVLVFSTTCDVPAGVTLTLEAGLVLKAEGVTLMDVDGALVANGTASDAVVFTSLDDDDHGGDSNSDGPSNGAPGDWRGIVVRAGGAVDLDRAVVRYSGSGGYSALFVQGAGAQVKATDCVFRDGSYHGVDANGNVCDLTVKNCAFEAFAQDAARDLRIEHCAGFTDNTATGNGGNFMRVSQPDPTADVTLTASNCLEGALVFSTTCDIPSGVTLRLEQGVVVKFTGGFAFDVTGGLVTAGVNGAPVVVTAFADDDFGGDTNGDGPSSGAPGSIRGVVLVAGSTTSVLEYAVVRYAGSGGYSAVHVGGAGTAATLEKTVLADSAYHGIDLNGFDSDLAVTGCAFVGNALTAVEGLRLDRCQNFLDNAAVGNGKDYMRVTSPDPIGQVSISPKNCMNGALVLASSCDVFAPNSLELLGGVVLKFESGHALRAASGVLQVKGDPGSPVVLTHLQDDEVVGDTNGDGGATVPTPGLWQGVRVDAAAPASSIANLVVRWAGSGGWNGLRSLSPLLTARAVRVEGCSADGFYLADLASGADLVAWSGNADGFSLLGGAFLLERCTAANNAGFGFQRSGAFGGVVNSSVSWGNGAGGSSGFTSGDLTWSNGDTALAGSNGNVHVDPLFVDAVNGDLRLSAGSPCIEAGDPTDFVSTTLDPDGMTRVLDGDLDKSPRVDMGAYEFGHVRHAVTGTFEPGGTLTFSSDGTPGMVTFLLLSLGE